MVSGAGDGAAIENIAPVRSIRAAWSGRLTHLEVLDEERRNDVHGLKVPPQLRATRR